MDLFFYITMNPYNLTSTLQLNIPKQKLFYQSQKSVYNIIKMYNHAFNGHVKYILQITHNVFIRSKKSEKHSCLIEHCYKFIFSKVTYLILYNIKIVCIIKQKTLALAGYPYYQLTVTPVHINNKLILALVKLLNNLTNFYTSLNSAF